MKKYAHTAVALIGLFSLPVQASAWRCTLAEQVQFAHTPVKGWDCTQADLGESVAPLAPSRPSMPRPVPMVLMAETPTPSPTRRGTVYRRMVNGVVEFSSRPAPGSRAIAHFVRPCYACRMPGSVDFATLTLNTTAFAAAIESQAQQHALDPAWVRAIVHAESAFDPLAVSPKGAKGLMQLMPATAARFSVEAPFDPAQNISGGVRYLAWLLRRYHGDKKLATAAYNAGEGAVDRYGAVPPFAETRTYVERVQTLTARYGAKI